MNSIADEILAIERARCEAEVRRDFDVLSDLFDDSLVYIHTNAIIDSKASLLQARMGYQMLRMTRGELQVQVLGDDVAIVTGPLSLRARMNGQEHDVNSITSQVFRKTAGRWRIVLQHSTRIP